MSTSTSVVMCAAVWRERIMCSAIARRWGADRDDLVGDVVVAARQASRPRGGSHALTGRRARGPHAAPTAAAAARTSALRIRPRRPVPVRDSIAMPCSAARRRATGEHTGAPFRPLTGTAASAAATGSNHPGRLTADRRDGGLLLRKSRRATDPVTHHATLGDGQFGKSSADLDRVSHGRQQVGHGHPRPASAPPCRPCR